MKATLTFDLDDVEDIDPFNAFALRVATEYSNVWIRKSSYSQIPEMVGLQTEK